MDSHTPPVCLLAISNWVQLQLLGYLHSVSSDSYDFLPGVCESLGIDNKNWEGWRGRSGGSWDEFVLPFSFQSTELWWRQLLSMGLSTSLFWQLRQCCWKTPGMSKHPPTRESCSPALFALLLVSQIPRSNLGWYQNVMPRVDSQICFAFPKPAAACVPGLGLAMPFVTVHWMGFYRRRAHCLPSAADWSNLSHGFSGRLI